MKKSDAKAVVLNLRQALKCRPGECRRRKHRRGKVSQKRVYYCTYCEGYHLTKWKWWLYGSRKRITLKTMKDENEFII